jgi:hypothetical protein
MSAVNLTRLEQLERSALILEYVTARRAYKALGQPSFGLSFDHERLSLRSKIDRLENLLFSAAERQAYSDRQLVDMSLKDLTEYIDEFLAFEQLWQVIS